MNPLFNITDSRLKTLAVVLNWNEIESTSRCIEHLENQKNVDMDIFVIDNNSQIDPSSTLQMKYPQIKSFFTIHPVRIC